MRTSRKLLVLSDKICRSDAPQRNQAKATQLVNPPSRISNTFPSHFGRNPVKLWTTMALDIMQPKRKKV